MGSGGGDDNWYHQTIKDSLTITSTTSPVIVDIVYGLHPDSSTGGCVVQRSFEESLRAAGVTLIRVHVASTAGSAEKVFRCLQAEGERGEARLLIVDGIALLFLREKLEALRKPVGTSTEGGSPRNRRVLVGFIHCPFSEPFYCKEPWLREALPDHLLAPDGNGLLDEETRLFGLFEKIIVVGRPCHSLLTTKYGVSEDSTILLEPTFPLPTAAATFPGSRGNFPPPAGAAAEEEKAKREASTLSPPHSPLRFVSVGTLCPRKGQLELVIALNSVCAAHPQELGGAVLTLIGGEGGDPAYAAAVRSAATQPLTAKGDGSGRATVRLMGSLHHNETLESLNASDAFLLNSCLESWAVAPVEAALRGVPVLTTKVGALTQALPLKSTIWVGGSTDPGDTFTGCALASVADWEKALVRFAQGRRELQVEAARAVPGLLRRFGQAATGSRALAVRELLKTAEGKCRLSPHPILSPPGQSDCGARAQRSQDSAANLGKTKQGAGGVIRLNGSRPTRIAGPSSDSALPRGPSSENSCSVNGNDRVAGLLAATEAERVRRASVLHSLACVCAACLSICASSGGTVGIPALVAAQLILFVSLAPPASPANVVTIFRSFIPPAVVWLRAGSDFGQVAASDVGIFGVLFVLLDIVDGALARRSKTGPTSVGAALDVESDSIAMLFLSLAASRKAWAGGIIAGVLRYLFVLATGARELPPSPVGPAGRMLAKVAALFSVVALALSLIAAGSTEDVSRAERGARWAVGGWGAATLLCVAGVAVLCASFSVDFYQILVVFPRKEAAAKKVERAEKKKRSAGRDLR